MKGAKLITSAVSLVILLSATGCIGRRLTGSGSGGGTKVIKSPDGNSQVTVPSSWNEDLKLSETADIQASDRRREVYVIVLSEVKAKFDKMDLKTHSTLTRNSLVSGLTAVETSEPSDLAVEDNPALQYEIRATANNVPVAYLHTTLETSKNYHQIIAWTLQSRFDDNRTVLQDVTQSFREIATATP